MMEGYTMIEGLTVGKRLYRVLLVDDDEAFRLAHKRLLHLVHFARVNASFEVVDVGCAERALNALRESQFDCVLLDYFMPGIDGIKCLKQIEMEWPDLPVIIFTGAGNEQVAVDALTDGARDYLIKGKLSLETLERAIVNAVTTADLLKRIEEQRKQLVDAERNRVMLHTLAGCSHHLAQPVTALRTFMVVLSRKENVGDDIKGLVDEAFAAVESMCDILWRMNHVSEYVTEPYLNTSAPGTDNEILKI